MTTTFQGDIRVLSPLHADIIQIVNDRIRAHEAVRETIDISIDEHWLTIAIPLPRGGVPHSNSGLDIVQRARLVPGNLKYVFGDNGWRLRADLPLDGVPVDNTKAGVEAVGHALGEFLDAHGDPAAAGECLPQRAPPSSTTIANCSSLGWSLSRMGETQAVVSTATSVGTVDVSLSYRESECHLVLSSPRCPHGNESSAIREAIAWYLTSVATMVRQVCVFRDSDHQPSLGICLASEPTTAELSHALPALRAAHELSARELQALIIDEDLADQYIRSLTKPNNGSTA